MAVPSTGYTAPSARLSQISGHLALNPFAPSNPSSASETSPSTLHQSRPTSPSAILIFAWGGATTSQLSRYVVKYSGLYPSAHIVPFGSPFRDFLPWPIRGQNQKEEGFDKILKACPPGQDGDNRVLVHIFSNGGSYRFCNLAARYLLTTDTPIPIRALIIDSAPSPCSPRSEADAVTRGLGLTGPIRLLSFAMSLVALSLQWIWTFITWQNEPFSWARKVLNDPAVVNHDSARVYIYSREDQIVDWRGVEAHAEEAQRQGFKVESERFEGSQHVNHAKAEPERYWSVIKTTWNSAVEAGDVASPANRKIDQAKRD